MKALIIAILFLLTAAPVGQVAADSQNSPANKDPLSILADLRSDMVHVQGGAFWMGCTPEQRHCFRDEYPVRRVNIKPFWMGRHEVTQALWQSVMGSNPSAFSNCPRCPVETVSWADAQIFLSKLNSMGGQYRLPSEAEWEYAARGGRHGKGRQYAGSDDWSDVAWIFWNAGNRTNPVGLKKPNELGLFDMSGNVREWVQDCWRSNYADAPADGAAWEINGCVRRTIRGGSWYGKSSYVRSANRFWYAEFFRNNNLGLRLATSKKPD